MKYLQCLLKPFSLFCLNSLSFHGYIHTLSTRHSLPFSLFLPLPQVAPCRLVCEAVLPVRSVQRVECIENYPLPCIMRFVMSQFGPVFEVHSSKITSWPTILVLIQKWESLHRLDILGLKFQLGMTSKTLSCW